MPVHACSTVPSIACNKRSDKNDNDDDAVDHTDELLKFKLTNQNSARGKNKSSQLFAIKGPENHLKDFVANFLSTNLGVKTGLPASSDSNVSCCVLAVVCALSNYFKTNSV